MSYKLYVFIEPSSAKTALIHDANGILVIGVPATHPSGRPGQAFTLPTETPDKNGATLILGQDGYYEQRFRGIVYLNLPSEGLASIGIDDFRLQAIPIVVPPEPPPPDLGETPWEIIQNTYATGDYELVTHDGCGKFTEACCKNLHDLDSDEWGHIKKNPGQNQYNGHAVDAIMLKYPSGSSADSGIYDIIIDSASVNAHPAFNYVSEPDDDLWYYPPAGQAKAQAKKAL